MTITLILLVAALMTVVWMALRLKMQVRSEQLLREEAETSKHQFIAEQERNRLLKQEMTSNIAHELKTPVSSIRGYLEILLADKPVSDEQRKYFMERCYSQTLRLSDLINDVSLINKLEESNDLFTREPVDIREQAEEAVRELTLNAEQHHTTIENLLPEKMVVNGNGMLLYSIFRNLIENAIEYAGDSCRVVIQCYKPDDDSHYFIQLYDTGKGVDNEYLPKLFDRFLRIDKGRSRKSGGTGLGLSIVKHAVLFHEGDIYVKNRDGGGLEFFFSIKR
ncbi:MAG: GHKL domain-containing protein [Bacteroidales bacterium]|nr:GHKL domain-containing protein [Bacteroidales bacterium]